ncbi:MAG TPA: M23 family metallopeptidase [Phototrophicaceae bacterium]|nr:M23 family metallopeptidase [Phototrophicaceae bacterium]
MKRLFGLIGLIGLWLISSALVTAQEVTLEPSAALPTLPPTPTPVPRPYPAGTLTQERVTLETFFTTLSQGVAGLLRVTGTGLSGCSVRFINKMVDCFLVPDDGFFALVVVNMEQNPRKYPLDVFAWFEDAARQTVNTEVEVTGTNFIKQNVELAPDKVYLIDPEVERTEFARLESIFATVTPERLWAGQGFQLPILGSELTSPFGAFRTFNQSFQTRHTGWDIRAALGQPIMAIGAGKVAYTGFMDIRGNIVIIDHGYGIYSTYSHLSQTHVTRGQSVNEGQIIGLVGNVGRTSGAHFHWEVAINGEFVDSTQFIQLWLPGLGPATVG